MKVTKRLLYRRIGRELANQELLTSDQPQLHNRYRSKVPEVVRDNQTPVQLSLLQCVGGETNTNADGYMRQC